MVVLSVLIVANQIASLSAHFPVQDSPSANAPAWVFRALHQLRSAGLIATNASQIRGGRPATRYEMAVETYSAASTLRRYAADMKGAPRGDFASASEPWALRFHSAIRLAKEFRIELVSLGVDASDFRLMIVELGRGRDTSERAPSQYLSFPDVLRDHWAARAVNGLKREGLLKGYPSGSFTGERRISWPVERASTAGGGVERVRTGG